MQGKKKIWQHIILYPEKTIFKNRRGNKDIFPDKQKLRKFFASKPALKEMLKIVLQEEEKLNQIGIWIGANGIRSARNSKYVAKYKNLKDNWLPKAKVITMHCWFYRIYISKQNDINTTNDERGYGGILLKSSYTIHEIGHYLKVN